MKVTSVVRTMGANDFLAVRELAARQPNFTIPPLYVLWLLHRCFSPYALVAEANGKFVGFLLALPIMNEPGSLFIWQLAVSANSAAPALLKELRGRLTLTQRVLFTAIPDSPAFRAISRYAKQVAKAEPRATGSLPDFIAPGEVEYEVQF